MAIGDLSVAAGVSSTCLAQRFKELIGVTPKRLARIYRFAATVFAINQAYFGHEFRAFAGLSPDPVRPNSKPHMEQVTRIEPALSAWEAAIICGRFERRPAGMVEAWSFWARLPSLWFPAVPRSNWRACGAEWCDAQRAALPSGPTTSGTCS
ncbi:hypothetical protein [Streptomyces chartreusis]|uniref:hypothetical protein n=1 Tax=Streptomyces chartreusis TaxID=1969 RepID=UPI003408F772